MISYIILDKIALNDVWLFNIYNKNWIQLQVTNPDIFESRFCHSSVLVNENIFIFGGKNLIKLKGMKNAEQTLDNLSVLSMNGETKCFETGLFINLMISIFFEFLSLISRKFILM